jgi:homoserine dehydrogenase
VRVWLIGRGTVGSWVERAIEQQGLPFTIAATATASRGFVAGGRRWPTALEGMRATEADVLVETTGSLDGYAHMREALERGIPVVTSSKWPVALHGVELAALARERGVAFRAESTVMSGTPVLSTLTEGLAGATPKSLRGLLNATVNFILTRMTGGESYAQALDAAQHEGLAERDPSADVDGDDAVAKVMVLSALVFGRQLRREDVECEGIASLKNADGLKHVATLGDGVARVALERIEPGDLLARVDGTANAVVVQAEPLGQMAIVGPGAGPQLAGQGVLSDLLAVARR